MMEQRVRDETGHDLPESRLVTGETEVAKGSWIEIWQGPYVDRTVIMIAYNLLQTLGYYGFAT
jgi:MFS transporter, putative metabolite:H+ symporter